MFDMKTRITVLILFSILYCSVISSGQSWQDKDTSIVVFNPLIDDIMQRIPPLEDLIDSALVHSPFLKVKDADVAMAKYRVKTARRDWMQNLYADGMVSTDIWDALTNNKTNLGDANTILSLQNNNRYQLSMSFRLPLDDLWDRRNRVKTAIKDVEKAMAVKENEILELRKLIIVQYNQLLVTQKKLKIANDNVTTNALQKEMGDKEFLNGQTTLYELANINEMNRKAITDFEEARNAFYNAYMILQEIAGIKFNVINKIE